MNPVAWWTLNGLLPGVVLTVTVWVFSTIRARAGARRRWRLTSPSSLRICVAQSATIDTGEYLKPATGIGQATALAIIVPALTRAWREIDLQRVAFPSQLRGPALETDLFLIGGPKNNSITADALAELASNLPVTQTGSEIRTKSGATFVSRLNMGQITTDYGLVIRAKNPFCPPKRLLLISGCHTYGVIAAARFVAESPEFKHAPVECSFVVKSTIRDSHALPPTVIWSSNA